MAVFETWIEATDRNKGDAVLVGAGEQREMALSFFDYAFSMSRYWTAEDGPVAKASSFFLSPTRWDPHAAREAADGIAALDWRLVEEIVQRILEGFLSGRKKALVLSNLKRRSSRLYQVMGL